MGLRGLCGCWDVVWMCGVWGGMYGGARPVWMPFDQKFRLKIFTSRFHHWIQHENLLENDVSYDPFSSFKKNPRWRPKLANF